MTPQYLAPRQAGRQSFAALRSQHISIGCYLYLFADESTIVRLCRSSATLRQAGSKGPVKTLNKTWRQRCPRASKHCWPLALLPLLQHVLTTRKSKNSSWSTLSRSRLSRNIPANTSNPGYTRFGQACRPVQPLTQVQSLSQVTAHISAPFQKGGA